jgi:hypothetical protein
MEEIWGLEGGINLKEASPHVQFSLCPLMPECSRINIAECVALGRDEIGAATVTIVTERI